uniref:PABP n=1 Tax=Entomoneis paludosa TaxID=265537 RepID=A0A6U3DAI6_9STRA|mmetsp:Transcript_40463/g.84181  ORF Transcript_40463/g.84181 Transcript_40463/m.84181 type:complete len:700 (+) Transcript_40463:2304-4403(+)|eukprot:CAMPEP_0172472618 /NCGR_PEP_ID=MMETSP1065-20121228/68428_1 /TAXON_ID=265537 /ORGANISM="Amphiprora paludosa, Strain CCMP125" /LENGTH=699 /DNA_ID=CAMNT_0013230767 /DNA_START=2691 /DNA_END=4790 /DNA_ORIENTATION=+
MSAPAPNQDASGKESAETPAPSSSNMASSGGSGAPSGEAGSFHTPSLYVGDLAPDVNESLLYEIFSAVGPVASIRVCRDAVTRRSLGYAYVNFHQLADAERSLDTMNFSMIKGKPCRIMWSQRDPSLRKSGVGNIFVKNLHESIDNKQLYDTFSLFGNILSCKVVTDREDGKSKGYGYVHYETAEAANAAIDKLDGMLIDGQEVQVGHFMRRNDRPDINSWTNIYIKNIPLEWDDARLMTEFEQFGEVISASIAQGIPKKQPAPAKKEEEGETPEGEEEPAETPETESKENEDTNEKGEEKVSSLGYGFVNFAEHEPAAAAVENLNGRKFPTTINGEETEQELYVGRAQKKAERERELRAKFEAEKMDRISKFQGVNLYVKNLDDTVTDDMLRDEFATMGTITSARVMKDMKDGRSRGFGFVCFSTPEESTRAVNEMNGKLIANKPIFVAIAQRREVRRAQLEAQHSTRGGPGGPGQPGMMRAPMGGPMGYPGMPMYMQRPGPGGGMQPAYPMMPQMMGGPGGRGVPQQRGYPMMGQQGRGGYPAPYGMPHQQGRGGRGPIQGRGGGGRGRGGSMQGGPGFQPIKFNQQARNAGGPMPSQPPQQSAPPQAAPAPMPHEGALTASALASATPEMQKNMIGERLYPLIHQSQPDLAGKITGMLLEMDNSELLHLLESPEALNAKISEALQVLEAHQAGQES